MIEADVWRSLIATLRQGMDANGLSSVLIEQAYQPVAQGVNITDTVYLFKITSNRVGFQAIKHVYNMANNNFDATENYWLQATFQLTSIIESNIQDTSTLTSYDVSDKCAAILQSSRSRKLLLDDGIGILRIGEVRSPYSQNDRDQFDQDSNFDFILTYNQTISSTVPIADPVELDIRRV